MLHDFTLGVLTESLHKPARYAGLDDTIAVSWFPHTRLCGGVWYSTLTRSTGEYCREQYLETCQVTGCLGGEVCDNMSQSLRCKLYWCEFISACLAHAM